MRKLILFSAAFLSAIGLYAQQITGTVTDAATGKPLSGVNLQLLETNIGTTTDYYGKYVLEPQLKSSYLLKVSFVGYQTVRKAISISTEDILMDIQLAESTELLEAVNIMSVRAADNTPIAKTNLNKAEIESKDDGRDVPFILKDLPNTVVSSDAGNGVGYTGIRIRGNDISRINVTVNGIPMNDPESHGVFWVNMPDIASSTNSLQVQRGVGTSTNGAGAFGASINMQTTSLNTQPFARAEFSGGSFNTFKRNVQLNSGLLNNHWLVEGRLSQITSDGYIDRASSDLTSYYLSGSYYSDNTSVQFIHFGGHEKTYQSWWGVPEVKLNNDKAGMTAYYYNNGLTRSDSINLFNSDSRTYNYYTYKNETDNYWQDHYQLHLSHRFSNNFKANLALHHTYGRGYYEQYRNDDDLADYGLNNVVLGTDTISSTDLIRRRWLHNTFTGLTYSFEYNKKRMNLLLGGAYNVYDGDHYGEIIWAEYASNSKIRDRYYDNKSIKKDFNTYLKSTYNFNKLSLFADLQFRAINYTGKGIDSDRQPISIDAQYNFFNPKLGFSYSLNESGRIYASAGVGQREPVRTDFLDALPGKTPTSEFMIDYEAGYEIKAPLYQLNANLFYMDYKNQLVLTGQINDVGSALRTNVDKSFRRGIELSGQYSLTEWFAVGANVSLSQNIIKNFEEYTPVYDDEFYYDSLRLEETDISFSPNAVGGIFFGIKAIKNFEIIMNTKYVGTQFLDNTSNPFRKIDAFSVTDLRFNYNIQSKWFENINLHLLAANLFNEMYAPNGYTYSYAYTYMDGGEKIREDVTDNHYFPMAGINFLGGIKIDF